MPEYRVQLARSYLALGLLISSDRPEEGEQARRNGRTAHAKLLADCPKNPEYRDSLNDSLFKLGDQLAKYGRHEDAGRVAIRVLDQAIELDSKNVRALSNRAMAYGNLGQWDKAIADYARILELAPKDAWANNDYAWFLATCPESRLRGPKRAVELAKRAVELAPKEGSIWNTLGVAYYRVGEWKAAIEALKKSEELEKGESFSFNAFFLAMAHRQLGSKDEARKWYDKAVAWMDKNQPQDEELKRFRAEAEELLGVKEKK